MSHPYAVPTETTFYRKVQVGKTHKYVAVRQYDQEFNDSWPKGDHLMQCYPGGKMIKFNVNANHAAMLAAGRVAHEAITSSINSHNSIQTSRPPMTVAEKAAWANLVKVWGNSAKQLQYPCASDVATAAVNVMVKQAAYFMENKMCKAAYDEFEATCRLVLNKRETT